MAQDDLTSIHCMDVRGCRKNALLTRKYLPVGCPLDAPMPVFDTQGNHTLPWRKFAWMWVDAGDKRHALYDGPHLYPRETVEVLMQENFLTADASTLPFAWAPLHRFPSAELADAFTKLQQCCRDDPEAESDGPCLSKRIVLATIGLWTIQERLAWSVHCTTQDADCPGPVTKDRKSVV